MEISDGIVYNSCINMAEKIFQNNPYVLEFQSRVQAAKRSESGYEVILEATAFYPEAGGQLCDKGVLDNREITGVTENEQGEIIHHLGDWQKEPGEIVSGIVDRQWRLDNMRKHTGQHILSRSFVQIAGADTLSSRLGETESTIELSVPSLDESVLCRVEESANDVIMQNLPVNIELFPRNELQHLPLRKVPEREGNYRIVQIGEFDYSACGGTHCSYTGEVGAIKIIGEEKLRGHLRVIFLTGRQAKYDYYEKHRAIAGLSGKLTCHYRDLERSVDRLIEQNLSLRREAAHLRSGILQFELNSLSENAPEIDGIKIIVAEYDGHDIKLLRETAAEAVNSGKLIIFICTEDKLLITVSKEIHPTAMELANLFMENFGGKGGGNPVSAQIGGIPPEKRKELLKSFMELLRNEIP
jgi:alanyl-tRNA synthetase